MSMNQRMAAVCLVNIPGYGNFCNYYNFSHFKLFHLYNVTCFVTSNNTVTNLIHTHVCMCYGCICKSLNLSHEFTMINEVTGACIGYITRVVNKL